MSLLDTIKEGVLKVLPSKNESIPAPVSTGVGHGMVPFEDDMIVSKPAIIFHTFQIFFNFLALCCFAAVASFQAHWKVGPTGLTGFALFVSLAGILLSLFMLLVPVLYEKYDRFVKLARAMREVRVGFILAGTGTFVSLLIAFITTVSAWTEPGCKNPADDPNAKAGGDGFTNALPGWCNTKKAGAVFFWFTFGFWLATLTLAVLDWRSGKLTGPRDPPFVPPTEHYDADDDTTDNTQLSQIPPASRRQPTDDSIQSPFSDSNRYSGPASSGFPIGGGGAYTDGGPAPRASMDAYGAFNDPPPSGFGGAGFAAGTDQKSQAGVSRTMQYADPYAAVRAQIAGGGSHTPPSYESYQGYR